MCSGTGKITRVRLRTHWPTVRRTQANTPFIVFEHPDGTLVILCSYLIHPFSHFYLCKHPTPMLASYPSGPLFKCHHCCNSQNLVEMPSIIPLTIGSLHPTTDPFWLHFSP